MNCHAAFRTILYLELVSVFKEASRNFTFIFLFKPKTAKSVVPFTSVVTCIKG
jgi:hypothetical protein